MYTVNATWNKKVIGRRKYFLLEIDCPRCNRTYIETRVGSRSKEKKLFAEDMDKKLKNRPGCNSEILLKEYSSTIMAAS